MVVPPFGRPISRVKAGAKAMLQLIVPSLFDSSSGVTSKLETLVAIALVLVVSVGLVPTWRMKLLSLL
jgi:hypothetical protein